MHGLTPMAGRAFGRSDGLPDLRMPRVPSDGNHHDDATSQVELYVDGKRVTLSLSVAIALAYGSKRAAEEKDEKTGVVGIPLEVKHIRD